jgi:hypothetical protein
MRGFGRWSLILNLPNPLTPTLSPLGRGSSLRQPSRALTSSTSVLAARHKRVHARLRRAMALEFFRARSPMDRALANMLSRLARNRSGSMKGQGWCLSFGLPLFRFRPINLRKRRKRNAGKRRSPTAASCDAARAQRSAHACRRSTTALA